MATTGADGTVIIPFSGSYSTKPVLTATPELSHGVDQVSVQIEAWAGDKPPYTGVTLGCYDNSGKPEKDVPLHWLIWSE